MPQTKVAGDDRQALVDLLATTAVNYPAGPSSPNGFFDYLIRQAPLTEGFRKNKLGTFKGPAPSDALNLIEWAQSTGKNPYLPEHNWTTLGSVLRALIDSELLGLDQVALVAWTIDKYGLSLDAKELAKFRSRYGVPTRPAPVAPETLPPIGPDIDWKGPEDPIELQSFFGPKPVDFTLEFLQGAVAAARSVCLVAFQAAGRTGTGVLISPTLVLTNHHVLFGIGAAGGDTAALAKDCSITFSGLAGVPGGQPSVSGPLDLANTPVVATSQALDYALLRIAPKLAGSAGLQIASAADHPPAVKDGANILHHPNGEALRVTISDAGIASIVDGPGYLQYVTRAAPGSSGAPCFDDDWKIVALHHGERSKPFGRVGEGILMTRILAEINAHLD